MTIEQGKAAGRTHNLSVPEATFERGRDSEILLSEQGISRQHARLQWESETWYLVDLGSRNGTHLNGRPWTPHQPHRLQGRDRIMIGGGS